MSKKIYYDLEKGITCWEVIHENGQSYIVKPLSRKTDNYEIVYKNTNVIQLNNKIESLKEAEKLLNEWVKYKYMQIDKEKDRMLFQINSLKEFKT